ncbi:winged helix-turn-helix domain-containing tetratricopeptide repeat protein [Bradyrhizobium sp. AUGA SZCCT0283]|uniref:winged helix-turn-helix domain-containing tetratricopeptide repeat protein n=1 Tax=Bradyrhizobium sp. AUGA SZCCT0283 TaxID=2807671 RepID=UPI001BA9C4F5|nr:winged helix-turn-helix domain-containing tetratricopeptide repeat protein [Bradyrhizobium sp. AUGA SZCCT0283]MBR1280391.1 winged helix-turn-helix domain-containing protein [Bradyrhizobium sp. AUGA SZCCT0283]
MRYLFENYALDIDRRELRRGPNVIAIAPKVFDLLNYLISNRERVVGKDDLITAVWDGRIISDAALTTRLNAARKAIGDSGDEQCLIKTFPRKGFRFVGTVQETAGPACASSSSKLSFAVHNRPSLVVLPFTNLSSDPEQEYFVDGVTESLTTDLSRMVGIFVIGRNTAFTYKGKHVDLKQIGRDLGVRYVLEGSVQRGGNRMRINVQLIEAETSNHMWAERFDKPIADLFDMQDEIGARLANQLGTELVTAEARRAARAPHPDSMDLYFRGMASANRGFADLSQAREFFEQALCLDPGNVEAMVGTAFVDAMRGTSMLSGDRTARLKAAETSLTKVLAHTPNHAMAHCLLGVVQIFTKRAAQGITECERALELDRNLASAYMWIGLGKCYLGRAEETEAHVMEAFRLSPRDNRAYSWMNTAGVAQSYLAADEAAVYWLRRAIETNPNVAAFVHFYLAAALAHLGRIEEARASVQTGLAIDPDFTLSHFNTSAPTDVPICLAQRARIAEGMRKAGLPEG